VTRVALVTAASRGIGAAIAHRLAEDGYRLALMSRSDDLCAVAAELDAVAFTGSVASADDLQGFVGAAVSAYGRIDAVVNNTGHAAKGDLLTLSDDDWHAGLDLLLLNVVRMARLATPYMEEAGGGSFVNISTLGAAEPSPAYPVSSALRAGLTGFTKLFAARYAAAGIRMNNVLPGFIDSQKFSADDVAKIPIGRPGRVEEIANAVTWLVSPAASYVTGQSLLVDGGLVRAI
jgi:NAD(P)-dependent dehydrogenase (short-subunit alcohol dehydrogenase family)